MKVKKTSVHVQGNFNFKDIDWPDILNKSGAALCHLTDIMNDHGLEHLVHDPTGEINTHFHHSQFSRY